MAISTYVEFAGRVVVSMVVIAFANSKIWGYYENTGIEVLFLMFLILLMLLWMFTPFRVEHEKLEKGKVN